MSNLVFPPESPGPFRLAWGNVRTPEFHTQRVEVASGLETSTPRWIYPRWHWRLTYLALGQAGHEYGDQLRPIEGFFLRHKGSGETFLFRDPEDHTITSQVVGTADGVTRKFQIIRNYGGFLEPIWEIRAGTLVVTNFGGSVMSGYTESQGLVQFAAPPHPENAQIRVTCEFYFRVRFTSDLQDFENFTYLLHTMREVRLQSVKR